MTEISLTDIEQAALQQMITNATPFLTEKGLTPHIFTNDKTNPAPAFIIDMFYKGVFENQVGVVVAKNRETGEEEQLLVAIAGVDGDNMEIYPIAKVLGQEGLELYAFPNGEGYDD